MNKKHNHCHCQHKELKHCAKCDIVYCSSCNKEWWHNFSSITYNDTGITDITQDTYPAFVPYYTCSHNNSTN